jgi:hypothetical protein
MENTREIMLEITGIDINKYELYQNIVIDKSELKKIVSLAQSKTYDK